MALFAERYTRIPVSHRIHQGIELAAQLSLYTPFIQIEELDVFQIEV